MEHLRSRYPRLADYVQSLPAGLESHPSCRVRASVLHALVDATNGRLLEPPPELQAILAPPPRPWIPEVVFQAATLAVGDHLRMDDARFLAWNYALNLSIYRGGVYRALMAFLSPRLLLERGASRWASFHQGSALTILPGREGNDVAGRLDFPTRLFSPLLLQIYAEAFRAALVHSRGRSVTVQLVEATDVSARFVARWE